MGSGKCQTFDLPTGNSEEPQRPLVFRGVSWRGARSAPWQSSWIASSLRFSQWQAVDQPPLVWGL